MTIKVRLLTLVSVVVSAALFCCSAPGVPQKQADAGLSFAAGLPPALSGKTITAGGKVFVDGLNNQPLSSAVAVSNKDGFDINGWAFDDKTSTVPERIFLELAPVKGGAAYYAPAKRAEREDLVKAFKNPGLKKAAYILRADVKSVPSGEYGISIIQVADGSAIKAPTGTRINKTD